MSVELNRLEVKNPYFESINKVTHLSDIKDKELFAYHKSYLLINIGEMEISHKKKSLEKTPKISLSPPRSYPITYNKKANTVYYLMPLHPLGFYKLIQKEVSALDNKTYELNRIINEAILEKLYNKIKLAKTLNEIEVLLYSFFKSEFSKLESTPIDDIIQYILDKKGIVTLNEILEKSSYSSRTLNRYFKKYIGITPALYIRLVKFNDLMFQLHISKTFNDLVLIYDFYDQTHLTKDFLKFANIKPSEYFGPNHKLLHQLFSNN